MLSLLNCLADELVCFLSLLAALDFPGEAPLDEDDASDTCEDSKLGSGGLSLASRGAPSVLLVTSGARCSSILLPDDSCLLTSFSRSSPTSSYCVRDPSSNVFQC